MDVSIVIVSYNTALILDECIASIKRETTCNHEIIVVDNASVDGSCRMLREKYPDVVLIENATNEGFARANNQGFALAQGKYYFMLNSDTVILDGAIDKLHGFMEKNPHIGISGPRNIGRDGNMQFNCDHFPGIWDSFCYYATLGSMFPKSRLFNGCAMRYWDYGKVKDVDRIVGCSLLIRSRLYKDLHGLDENYFMYFEETDFCYRARKIGMKTTYNPSAVIVHYGGESSKNNNAELVVGKTVSSYFQRSQYYYYRKNYGLISLYSIRFLNLMYGLYLFGRNSIRQDDMKRKHALGLGKFMIKSAWRPSR